MLLQEATHPVVDLKQRRLRHEPSGYGPLVGDDDDLDACVIESTNGCSRLRKELELRGLTDVRSLGRLTVDRPVAIQEYGPWNSTVGGHVKTNEWNTASSTISHNVWPSRTWHSWILAVSSDGIRTQ